MANWAQLTALTQHNFSVPFGFTLVFTWEDEEEKTNGN
jgi:hypothetical protein